MLDIHQFFQLALAEHRVIDVQAGELSLPWQHVTWRLIEIAQFTAGLLDGLDLQVIQNPVVQWAMIFKLQCAQRMRDMFQCIRDAMGIVIHRIDVPGISRLVVNQLANTVDNRITHINIG